MIILIIITIIVIVISILIMIIIDNNNNNNDNNSENDLKVRLRTCESFFATGCLLRDSEIYDSNVVLLTGRVDRAQTTRAFSRDGGTGSQASFQAACSQPRGQSFSKVSCRVMGARRN